MHFQKSGRRATLLLVLMFTGSVSAATARFGPEVYLGKDVPNGRYLTVTGITGTGQRLPDCTGVLISANIVLTAAHCLCDGVSDNIYVGDDPKIKKPDPQGYYKVVATRSRWDCKGSDYKGKDIAVLKIKGTVRNIQPVSFATPTAMDQAEHMFLIGFGAIDANGRDFRHQKLYGILPVVDSSCTGSTANASNSTHYGCSRENEIVAGRLGSPDACKGDSGGPLFVVTGSRSEHGEGAMALAGIASRAVNNSQQRCGGGAIYTRMNPATITWIKQSVTAISGIQPAGT